jgi:hypothetical protein
VLEFLEKEIVKKSTHTKLQPCRPKYVVKNRRNKIRNDDF